MISFLRKIIPEDSFLRIFYSWSKAIFAQLKYGNPSKDLIIIGVTGTDGKTSTVQFTTQLLEKLGVPVAMISSESLRINGKRRENPTKRTTLNPFSTQAFLEEAKNSGCKAVILEVSSHAIVQGRIFGIEFDGAIMTSISQEHGNYHKTMEEYAEVKSKLFQRVAKNNRAQKKILVLNKDMEFFDIFGKVAPQITKTYALNNDSTNITAGNIQLFENGSSFTLYSEKEMCETQLNIGGSYNIENILAASLIAEFFGFSLSAIAKVIPLVQGVPGRLEKIETEKGFDVFIDFALTPGALKKLLSFGKSVTQGNVWIVFGGCGGNHDHVKFPMMGKTASELADFVIITEDETYGEDNEKIMAEIEEGFEEGFYNYKKIPDRKAAIYFALENAQSGDTIFITGMGAFESRNNGKEEIAWSDKECVKEWLSNDQ